MIKRANQERNFNMDNELYMNELIRLLEEVNRYFKLFPIADFKGKEDMAKSNLEIIKEIAKSEYEIISDMIPKYSEREKERIKEILSGIKKFLNQVDAFSYEEMYKSYNELSQIKMLYEQEKNKNKMLKEVFQSDIEEMRLHETKLKTLQDIVNLDLKLYGEISDATIEVIKVQHCTLKDNHVMEIDDTIQTTSVLENERGKDSVEELGKYKNRKISKREGEKSYQGSAYLKGTGKKQTPIILYGSSPEDIIARLQGWNMTRTEEMKLVSCYIRKLNPETNKYENTVKYNVITGEDITPIYLNLPHMEKNSYLKIVDEIKKNGAKYNPQKKAFYIIKQNDLNKFSKYLPLAGTHSEQGENRSQNELPYEIEAGQEYYDNRVKVTIEGMEPFNVYGDDHGVHFPSLSSNQIKEIIEKFVFPTLDTAKMKKEIPKEIEYDGEKYNPLQYDVLMLAEKQNFTPEQMAMLKNPELTSDRLNEIRFAIKDGLPLEQIRQFATPVHEQWQMDFCRIGLKNGLKYEELKDIIRPEGYSADKWGSRRAMLSNLIKEKKLQIGHNIPNLPHTALQKEIGKDSVISKLNHNKSKIETFYISGKEHRPHKELESER